MKKFVSLPGQPWDQELLKANRLYRRSRELFLARKGKFEGVILSSPRSLGSVSLIENKIQYNPIEQELKWSLADRLQKKDEKHFDVLRSFTTNVFHEQNHRNLWNFFSALGYYCPQEKRAAFRFMNFSESLIVALDFALGDQIGLRDGKDFYRLGVLYSPGSDFLRKFKYTKRIYRNYLQIVVHAVFLRLEGMHPEDIPPAVHTVFAHLDVRMVEHALGRAFLLDNLFVELTNPTWQGKHIRQVMEKLGPGRIPGFKKVQGHKGKLGKVGVSTPLILPDRKPLDHTLGYVLAEKWFEQYGL